MLVDNNLVEVIYTQMYTSMSTCQISFIGLSEDEREYAAQFMSSGLCRMTQKYLKEHKRPDANELIRISYKIMSGSIYRTK